VTAQAGSAGPASSQAKALHRIRRCEETAFAAAASADQPPTAVIGTSQALAPFPQAGLLGTVTGFCPASADIDIATVSTATIAHHMTVIAPDAPADDGQLNLIQPSGGHAELPGGGQCDYLARLGARKSLPRDRRAATAADYFIVWSLQGS
jgi:hypothetical protein